MVSINITEEEASVIYSLASEVDPEDGTVLDKMWRKFSAAQTNHNHKNLRMFAGGGPTLTPDDVDGPLSKINDPECKNCGDTGHVVVEEYLMTTEACPVCNPQPEDKTHAGDALEYPRI